MAASPETRFAARNFAHVADKPVAPPGYGLDESIGAKRLSQRINVLRQIRFLDKAVRPKRFHQLAFFDDIALVLDEDQKGLDRLLFERYGLAITHQSSVDRVDTKVAELVNSLVFTCHLGGLETIEKRLMHPHFQIRNSNFEILHSPHCWRLLDQQGLLRSRCRTLADGR